MDKCESYLSGDSCNYNDPSVSKRKLPIIKKIIIDILRISQILQI